MAILYIRYFDNIFNDLNNEQKLKKEIRHPTYYIYLTSNPVSLLCKAGVSTCSLDVDHDIFCHNKKRVLELKR